VYYYFIEGIDTEKDQDKGIEYPEIEIGRCDITEDKGNQYPGNHKDCKNGNKYIFPAIE
jgi:hypothetical protein